MLKYFHFFKGGSQLGKVTVRTAEVGRQRIGESPRLHRPLAESGTTKRYTKPQRVCGESRFVYGEP